MSLCESSDARHDLFGSGGVLLATAEEKGGGNVLIPTVPLLTPINGKNWSTYITITMVNVFGALFFLVASGTVVVCKNNTRVLARSGPERGKH